MTAAQERSIQNQVMDYFKDVDDPTFVLVVDAFVYMTPSTQKVGSLVDKFIKDNGITEAYINVVSDLRSQEDRFFNRASPSQCEMIHVLHQAFLNASFNRFRRVIKSDKSTAKTINSTIIKRLNKSIDKLLDAGNVERFDEAIDELKDYYYHHIESKKK